MYVISIYSEYQICENNENLNCLSAMLRADEGKMRGSNLGGNLSRAFEFERCKFTGGEGEFLKSWWSQWFHPARERDAVKYVQPEFWMHRVISDLVSGEASSKIIKSRDYLFFRLPCRATACDPRFHVLRMEKNDKFSWALREEQFSRAIISFEFELID